jgi:hypothetical protein
VVDRGAQPRSVDGREHRGTAVHGDRHASDTPDRRRVRLDGRSGLVVHACGPAGPRGRHGQLHTGRQPGIGSGVPGDHGHRGHPVRHPRRHQDLEHRVRRRTTHLRVTDRPCEQHRHRRSDDHHPRRPAGRQDAERATRRRGERDLHVGGHEQRSVGLPGDGRPADRRDRHASHRGRLRQCVTRVRRIRRDRHV